MKLYTTKSNAKRAAQTHLGKEAVEGTHYEVILQQDKRWSWHKIENLDSKYGCTYCPKCKVHLSNGVMAFTDVVESMGSKEKALEVQKKEWSCMACESEWGKEIQAKTKQLKMKKSKVEGPCRLVWDIASDMPGARRKDIIEKCVKAGVAYATARTQYQQWFSVNKNS